MAKHKFASISLTVPEAKASKNAVLSVIGSKGFFVSSLSTTDKFHLGMFLVALGLSR